ncbi:uncharacterized protein BYT42DRAFT_549533 [Radiomyces spectabilis]|uniref:uncharacterized protein n=1 Tax=Radiomyces spectabilis TaxID=64574 RepID=UPI00221EC0FB|nr:uncharacterized protein BYT42DRAFT_549533 [Radiomyces spectabilis]KAI8367489.1 hypothetical protein BYT42DRAFT_549533 [Radiomyces spectabilis]
MSENLAAQLEAMQAQINTLIATTMNQAAELAKFRELATENRQLRNEVAELKTRLASLASDPPIQQQHQPKPAPATLTNEPLPASSSPRPPLGSDASSWAVVTKKKRPTNTTRLRPADVRIFQTPSGPSGFKYLYVPRSRRLTRQETRTRLRRLGIDPYRVLDICFPARAVVGLLVHEQYFDFAMAQFTKAEIKPLENFDPLDISILADPEIKAMSTEHQEAFVFDLYRTRCEKAVTHLPYHLASPVARSFVEANILEESDLPRLLGQCRGAPASPANPTGQKQKSSTDPDHDMQDVQKSL